MRQAWLLVAVGLIVPVLAILGARKGMRLREQDGSGHVALIALGFTVFAVRLVIFAIQLS